MVVCKFFLQGSCKYGNNCWNEHPSGGNQGYSVTAQRQLFGGGRRGSTGNQNPYRWHAQDNQQQNRPLTNTTQQLSAADTVKGLASEITLTWEGGKMWPFSCLGFEKEMPSLPGFTDISMEEMRHEAYEAQKQGNIHPYIQKVESAFNELNTQRQELKNPSMSLRQKLITFVDNCRRNKTPGSGGHVSLFSDSSGGGGLFGGASGSNNLFGQSSSQPSSNLFGNSGGSTFGQSGSSAFGQSGSSSLFGQSGNQSAFGQAATQPSAFGQSGTQSLFGQSGGQSTFGQSGSAFGQSGSQSLFGQTGAQSAFGQSGSQSAFGQSNQSSQQSTGFGQATFGQSTQSAGLFGKPVQESGSGDSSSGSTGLFGKSESVPFGGGFSTPQASGTVGQPGFGTPTFSQQATPVKNVFGGTSSANNQADTSTFGSQPVKQESSQTASTGGLYTPMDKLTPEEIEQFKAQTFTLGKIPTKPPPKELCF